MRLFLEVDFMNLKSVSSFVIALGFISALSQAITVEAATPNAVSTLFSAKEVSTSGPLLAESHEGDHECGAESCGSHEGGDHECGSHSCGSDH
jgi:uncharacterized low-complexity protein